VVYDNNTVFLHGKEELAAKIEEILSPSLPPALVGCDEAGKGEGFGSLFAVCSIFPRSSYVRLRGTVSTLSTKKRVELSRLREAVEEIMRLVKERGLEYVSPFGEVSGEYALPRKFEVAAAVNRLRSLRVKQRG